MREAIPKRESLISRFETIMLVRVIELTKEVERSVKKELFLTND